MMKPDTRFSRHFLVEGFTKEHQEMLSKASVFVAGAGGLGSALLTYLAAVGVGHLSIVDFDVVSVSNLNRQILYTPSSIGKSKTHEAMNRIKLLNPDCRITLVNEKITSVNCLQLINGFNVVADASDNFATRYDLDDACSILRIPYVYASAEQWGGQLSVFHYKNSGSYRQLYPEPPQTTQNPPGIIGPVPGLIGTYEALEVIKIITGLGTPLTNKLLCLDALNHTQFIFDIDGA